MDDSTWKGSFFYAGSILIKGLQGFYATSIQKDNENSSAILVVLHVWVIPNYYCLVRTLKICANKK